MVFVTPVKRGMPQFCIFWERFITIVTGSIVMCKTKVAPVKTLSIPKLELLSCLLLSQLMEKVLLQMRRILKIEKVILWSDSMDSLYWIKSMDKKRTQSVKNKIEKIRVVTSHENWRHVPGKINPADLPSQGSTKENEIKSWLSVPEFLQNNRDWPPDISSDEKYRHVHQSSLPMETDLTVLPCHTNDNYPIDVRCLHVSQIIDINCYSNLGKLCRVTSYVMRFIMNIKQKTLSWDRVLGSLKLEEVNSAEKIWTRGIQNVFKEDEKYSKNLTVTLCIYLDSDHILKCRGRLNNSDLPKYTRNPILLPKDGHFTNLIINQAHQKVKHCGVKYTLTEIRSRFWIIQGNKVYLAV